MSDKQKDEFRRGIKGFMDTLRDLASNDVPHSADQVYELLNQCRNKMYEVLRQYPGTNDDFYINALISVLISEIQSRLSYIYPRNNVHIQTEIQFNTLFEVYGFTLTINPQPRLYNPEVKGPETALYTDERHGIYPRGPPPYDEGDPLNPPPGVYSAYYTIVNNLHRRLCALERRK